MSVRHKGRRCIVAGCSNTGGDGVSVHTFPNDTKTLNAWKRFVRLKRSDWVQPSKHSAICSAHFEPSCFNAQYDFKAKLGFSTKRRLDPGSVPSIYPKRPAQDMDELNDAFLSSPFPGKRRRGAFVKRESARAISELAQNLPSFDPPAIGLSADVTEPVVDQNDEMGHITMPTADKENAISIHSGFSQNQMLQEMPQIILVDKNTQARVKTKEKGVCVDISPFVRSIGVQCELMPPTPAKENPATPRKSCQLPVPEITDMDITPTPSDTSSISDGDMSMYEPSSSDTSSDSETEHQAEHTPRGAVGERKFIVS